MKFNLDTNDYETLKLVFDESEYNQDLAITITEFCYAMAAFYLDFALKLELDADKALSLKEVCLNSISGFVDDLVSRGLLVTGLEEDESEDDNELES